MTRVFRHYNELIHTARNMMTCLEKPGIIPPDWPPHSPELDSIEIMWSCLKNLVSKRDQKLAYMMESQALLKYLKGIAMDTPGRLQAAIASSGWYTY